jgi:hypothetical protein
MQKFGSGVITTTHDVDCLEFDWGKTHFLSEPLVTNADRFSFGVVGRKLFCFSATLRKG